MGANRLQYILLTVIAEIAYLYPLYYLIAVGLKTPQVSIISIWTAFLPALLAVIANKILDSKKMRKLTKFIIYALLGAAVVLWLVRTPLLFSWEEGLIPLLQNWNLALLIIWIWFRVMLITRKIPNYSLAVSRFEMGLALIFIFFLLASLLNISIQDGLISLILFFLSNAGALSLTKWEKEGLASPWPGLGFAALFLIPLALTVSLMLPLMNKAAGTIYQIATPVLIFARDLFAHILIFLFKKAHIVQDRGTLSPTVKKTQDSLTINTGGLPVWLEYILRIIGWVVIIVILLLIFLLIIYLLRRLFLKLLKVEAVQSEPYVEDSMLSWLKNMLNSFRQYLNKIWVFIRVFLPRKISVFEAYNALLAWGVLRKYPREKQETPYEYCERLSKGFPQQKANLKVITDCYVAFKYGNKKPSQEAMQQLASSIRKLYLS